jgi:hypothetical protein
MEPRSRTRRKIEPRRIGDYSTSRRPSIYEKYAAARRTMFSWHFLSQQENYNGFSPIPQNQPFASFTNI